MTHGMLVERLGREFGLGSAYHAAQQVEPGSEEPTLYWQWKQEQPFHVDDCLLPTAWVPHFVTVTVGAFDEWSGKRDHRPLVVDVRGPEQHLLDSRTPAANTEPPDG
jgi:hypothetical protein